MLFPWPVATVYLGLFLTFLFNVRPAFAAQPPAPEVEPNDTPASATPLDLAAGYAQAIGGISARGDKDFYSFTALPGSKVWILVDSGGTPGPSSESTDSFVTLIGANGTTQIEEDDDDGSGNGCDSTEESAFASTIAGRTLIEGGAYFVRVNEFGDDAILTPYRLLVVLTAGSSPAEVEPNGIPALANSLVTTGGTIGVRAGSLAGGGDEDVFALDVQAGEVLFVGADADPERNGVGTDLIVDLIATNRTSVLYTANSSADEGGAAEGFCYTVPATGTYYVRLRGGPGTYNVMAGSRPPGTVQFASAVYRVNESAGTAAIQVLRTGGTAGSLGVKFNTANGSAVIPSDYSTNSGTLSFGDGVVSQTFNVSITPDMLTESNETVQLTLSMPSGGAVLGPQSTAVLVILDDDEPVNNGPGSAISLNLAAGFGMATVPGTALPPTLSPPGDVDWYSFSAPAGSRAWVFVDTGGTPGLASDSRDSQLSLVATNGQTTIEDDDDDGSGNGCGPEIDADGSLASAIAGRTLDVSGTYFLRINAFDQEQVIDPYNLFVAVTTGTPLSEVEGNDTPITATAILTGGVAVAHRLGQIGLPGDVDFYSVTAMANSVLYISADCDPYRNGLAADLVVDLLSIDGATVLFSADSSGSEAAAAEAFCFRVPSMGTYFVRVRHFSASGVGAYGLMVARSGADFEPNNSPATALTLPLIDPVTIVSGMISTNGDEDYFKFTAVPGSKLWVSIDTGGIQLAGANSRDCTLTLLASNGTTVIEQDLNDGTGNGCDATIESSDGAVLAGRTLVDAGPYYLRVQAAASNLVINPYTLFVVLTTSTGAEVEPNGTAAAATSLLSPSISKASLQGQIGSAADVDFYSMTAGAGDALFICADGDPERDGTGTNLRLELLGTDGATLLLAVDSAGAGTLVDPAGEGFCFRVPAAGTYFLRVRHATSGSGSYQVMAARDRGGVRLLSEQVIGMDLQLSFTTEAGRNYALESTPSINPGHVWARAPGTVAGTGGVVQFLHSQGALGGSRFHRVVQVP